MLRLNTVTTRVTQKGLLNAGATVLVNLFNILLSVTTDAFQGAVFSIAVVLISSTYLLASYISRQLKGFHMQ